MSELYNWDFSKSTQVLSRARVPINCTLLPLALLPIRVGNAVAAIDGPVIDMALDYMTTDNLLDAGRSYVNDFTGATLREIPRPK